MTQRIDEHFDAVVLGAGISGLVSASELLRQGCQTILIVDEYDRLGGNHIDCTIGGYTFDAGSYIFQDDSPLLGHFPDLLSRYTPISPTWARLNPQGLITSYPISFKDDIVHARLWGMTRILASLLYARLFQRKQRNARDFARYWIGDFLLRRSGLESYMKRFYGVPADAIDIQLAQKRMLWISENARIRSLARRLFKAHEYVPTNKQLARPKQGFGYLYEAAEERLTRDGVKFKLRAPRGQIGKAGKTFQIQLGQSVVTCGRLISTIPVTHAQAMCGVEVDDLKSITLISLYFSFDGKRGFDQSIIYNFSHQGAWKRLTMYSDFYGLEDGREYFTAEVIADHIGRSHVEAEKDFRAHVAANGLFVGDLKLEGSQELDNAYPIYSERASERAAMAIRALKEFGVESLGRQGGFNYQPTARVSTIEAEAALRAQDNG